MNRKKLKNICRKAIDHEGISSPYQLENRTDVLIDHIMETLKEEKMDNKDLKIILDKHKRRILKSLKGKIKARIDKVEKLKTDSFGFNNYYYEGNIEAYDNVLSEMNKLEEGG